MSRTHEFARRTFLGALIGAGVAACTPLTRERPELVAMIARAKPAVLGIGNGATILGTGFRLRDSPYVLTAAHVLDAIGGAAARLRWRGRNYPGRVVLVDDALDLGVLRVDPQVGAPGLPLASGPVPPVGTWVVVLGCPFGADTTATTGIVSSAPGAIEQPAALKSQMQLNAAVNPGNSGGPVLDLDGAVVGIANATIPGGFGLGFALPSAAIAARLAHLANEKPRGP
jgi:serine protease Do